MGHNQVKYFIIGALVVLLAIGVGVKAFEKPSIHEVNPVELCEIKGLAGEFEDGVFIPGQRLESVMIYLKKNPECSVEDLKNIKGIGDHVVNQLRRKYH